MRLLTSIKRHLFPTRSSKVAPVLRTPSPVAKTPCEDVFIPRVPRRTQADIESEIASLRAKIAESGANREHCVEKLIANRLAKADLLTDSQTYFWLKKIKERVQELESLVPDSERLQPGGVPSKKRLLALGYETNPRWFRKRTFKVEPGIVWESANAQKIHLKEKLQTNENAAQEKVKQLGELGEKHLVSRNEAFASFFEVMVLQLVMHVCPKEDPMKRSDIAKVISPIVLDALSEDLFDLCKQPIEERKKSVRELFDEKLEPLGLALSHRIKGFYVDKWKKVLDGLAPEGNESQYFGLHNIIDKFKVYPVGENYQEALVADELKSLFEKGQVLRARLGAIETAAQPWELFCKKGVLAGREDEFQILEKLELKRPSGRKLSRTDRAGMRLRRAIENEDIETNRLRGDLFIKLADRAGLGSQKYL